MANYDLLNASDYLDAPTSEPVDLTGRVDAAKGQSYSLLDKEETDGVNVDLALPTTLNIGGFDTGLPLSKKAAATLVGLGDGMLDLSHGIQQLLGSEALKADLQIEQDIVKGLYNDPRYGTAARTGQFGGFLVDPIGVLVPVGKAKSLGQILKTGAATGATFAGLGYVDEKEGQTRVGNALIGAVTGGVLSPTLFAATRGVKGAGHQIQQKSADMLLKTYNKQWNRFIKNGANPQQATDWAMKQMGWSNNDKAELMALASRDWTPDVAALYKDANGNVITNPLSAKARAQRVAQENLDAMMSRPAVAWDKFKHNSPWAQTMDRYAKKMGQAVNKALTPINTRLLKLDKDVALHLSKMESNTHNLTHYFTQRHKDLLDHMKITENDAKWGQQFRIDLMSGDFAGAKAIWRQMHGTRKLKMFDEMVKDLKMFHKELRQAGYSIGEKEFYFPRRVVDYDGLANMEQDWMSQSLRDFMQVNRRNPTDRELRGILKKLRDVRDFQTAKTGKSLRERTIDKLTEEHLQYYDSPSHALFSYINDTVGDIERAKFFKRQGVIPPEGFKIDGTDLDGQNGILEQLLAKNYKKGKYASGEVNELVGLLKSRFGKGEQAPGELVSAFKNSTYIATLGNFKSALTQFGDVAFSAHRNGIMNTAVAWVKGLPGLFKGKGYTPKDPQWVTKAMIGLDDALQEFASNNTTSKKVLDHVLTYTGFRNMDRLGKETFINAHLSKVSKALNNPKKVAAETTRIRNKWGNVFGADTEKLIKDLKEKRFSDHVQTYLFDSLADVQPIALNQMPQMYLDHPNGRLFYMLRSFTIKQLDLMRRDILTKMARGEYKEGAYNFLSLSSMFVLANGTADMAKDFVTGEEIEMEDTLVDNVWKLMGMNRYTGDRVMAGTPGKAAIDMLAPPLTVYDRLFTADSVEDFYKLSPFNGSQALMDLLKGEGWRESSGAESYKSLDLFHDTFDSED